MDDDCADTVAVGSSNEPLPGSSVSDVSKPGAIFTASSTMASSIWLAFSSTLMKWALASRVKDNKLKEVSKDTYALAQAEKTQSRPNLVTVEALAELLHEAALGKTDKLLLCLAVDDARPKSVQEIKSQARQAGLRFAEDWKSRPCLPSQVAAPSERMRDGS